MRSSLSARTQSRRRGAAARLAGLGAAGVVATFVAAPIAAAADTSTPTDTTTADAGTATGAATTTAADPGSSTAADAPSSSAASSDAPSSGGASSSTAAGGSSTSAGGGSSSSTTTAGTNTVRPNNKVQQVKPQLTLEPNFGSQKIRVGIQTASGSWYPPGASLANSTIQAVETGPNAPGGDPATCTTDSAGICSFGPPLGMYWAAPGDTVTFTQITPPDGPGIALNPEPQVVGPCVIPAPVVTDVVAKPAATTTYPDCGLLGQTGGLARPALVTRDVFGAIVTIIDPGIPPTAVNDTASVHTGGSVNVAVLANDTTGGAPTTITAVTHPAHGTATIAGDHVVYTSTAGYGGVDSFQYTIQTPNGTSTATVTINVIAPPIAVNDSADTFASTPVTINVLANDSANGGANLHIASATTPGHGTISFVGGSIVYKPDNGFTGTDTFTYTISTDNGSATALVTIHVMASGLEGLANTGADTSALTSTATLLLLGGGGAVMAGRKRRVRRAH